MNVPFASSIGMTTLDRSGAGSRAVIERVDLPVGARGRLYNLGFYEGQHVRVVQAGKPMIVDVLGARIGIHHNLAAKLHIRPL